MLRSATKTLTRRFASDLRALIPQALAAGVDESTSAIAYPMRAADAALLDEWSTYRNVFPEPPAEVLRAMLVGAVAQASEHDFFTQRAPTKMLSGSDPGGPRAAPHGGPWCNPLVECSPNSEARWRWRNHHLGCSPRPDASRLPRQRFLDFLAMKASIGVSHHGYRNFRPLGTTYICGALADRPVEP
ncbi:GTPase-associated system all-helical protein GASH [Diaminobutyricimonas aerilata]|uniref:GTPase-associated system all-helical protein GASH n=1 Tax=Diaminobutyricimonas aerilata TaxID=1162967 RepID=UPI003CCBE8FF